MEYNLPSYVSEHLKNTGEDPEAFMNRAVSAAVLKDKMNGWSELPYCAVLDVFATENGLLLLTFADGDRRIFDTDCFKDNPIYKELTYPSAVTCVVTDGYTAAFKDKHGIFNELPPEFLYNNSVSISCFKSAVQQAAAEKRVKRSFEHLDNRSSAQTVTEKLENVRLPDSFVKEFDN
ncbi:MAG: hypothetical protein Q3989_09840 [Eubacteriales bacterium]|nr:hypothetical protein [Eubacteriales bacterium]